ncbi:MAG TPA: zinc-ribbon domain-containing protein [Terriglobales bacterium]|nr:zinc-ribbon domain-containing protein [Terriglobales bacterium]
MAFCTSCGANIADTADFCTACGAKQAGRAVQAASTGTAVQSALGATPQKSGSGLKIVLIAVGLICGILVLLTIIVGLVGWRIARHSRVVTTRDGSRIETPFGKVETTENTEQAVKNIGVDVYPGAKATKGASVVQFGGMTTASAVFETSDPPEQVANFYREKFPNAMANTNDQSGYSIVSSANNRMVSIHIQARGGVTRIEISNISGMKNVPGMPSNPQTTTQ